MVYNLPVYFKQVVLSIEVLGIYFMVADQAEFIVGQISYNS